MIVAVCKDAGVKHVVTVGFEDCDADIPEAIPVPQLRAKTAIEKTIKVDKFAMYGAGQIPCSRVNSLQEPTLSSLKPIAALSYERLQPFLIDFRNPALPTLS